MDELIENIDLTNIYDEEDETRFLMNKEKNIEEAQKRYKRYIKNISFEKKHKYIKNMIKKFNNKSGKIKKLKLINSIDNAIIKELNKNSMI